MAVIEGRESLEIEHQRDKYFELIAENMKVSQEVVLSIILVLNMKHFGYNKCNKEQH